MQEVLLSKIADNNLFHAMTVASPAVRVSSPYSVSDYSQNTHLATYLGRKPIHERGIYMHIPIFQCQTKMLNRYIRENAYKYTFWNPNDRSEMLTQIINTSLPFPVNANAMPKRIKHSPLYSRRRHHQPPPHRHHLALQCYPPRRLHRRPPHHHRRLSRQAYPARASTAHNPDQPISCS
jgi:hypothetical protein